MCSGLAEMWGVHHCSEGGFDGPRGIGEKGGYASERLFLFGVEDMEDRADEKGMAGLFPMVTPFKGAFRVDQNVSDVLYIANLPFALSHFKQGIVGRGACVRRIEP